MHELKFQSTMSYERVWNSLASLDPFPLALFLGNRNRPSISRLRSDILPSFRVDWTEGRKRQWVILSLTNLDFLNSTMTIEVSDGHIKSLDSAQFQISLLSNDEGCEISLKYIAQFRFMDRILPTGAQRKFRKQILQFNFDEALKAESRFSKITD